ncbi:MAG: hypothetical protein OEY49_19485 [Candidatus Heimdallarchaeota archaeon]|nr:hypothetical protein [Candidatus Heimdallarchaeota archaeon]
MEHNDLSKLYLDNDMQSELYENLARREAHRIIKSYNIHERTKFLENHVSVKFKDFKGGS